MLKEEECREQMSKNERERERAVVKTSEKKHLQQTTLLRSKQGDGAFFEALGFLRSELDLKD